MREIKFRAWNGETMISPDYIDRQGVAHWHENSIPESTDKVMLWTGLLDKQNVEIYEGDIVNVTPKSGAWNHEVYWNDEYAGWYIKSKDGNEGNLWGIIAREYYEVTGNIYENPELIQGA